MHLQPASRKEVKRMALGCSVCAIAEIAGLFLISQFGIMEFSYRVLIGTAGGTVIAICNFILMCMMIQNAAGTEDKKLLRAKVQASYNLRLFVQAAWVVAAFLIPWINLIAAVIPLIFPNAVIYFLQARGKLLPADTQKPTKGSMELPEEPREDEPGPFEI